MKKKFLLIIILLFITSIIFMYFNNNNLNNLYKSLVFIESIIDEDKLNGSGFVYKENYIITNYHVISNSNEIYVYDKDNNKAKAYIVGFDELNDIAVLKVSNLNLKSIKIGNSNNVKVFDDIYVFGNPIDDRYFGTITSGVVSYVNRKVKYMNKNRYSSFYAIQIDAPISNGNSGGILLNKKKKVIGMITLKENDIAGVGFAIPINKVIEVVNNIIK